MKADAFQTLTTSAAASHQAARIRTLEDAVRLALRSMPAECWETRKALRKALRA